MLILKAVFTRELVLSFASRLKLPSMFIVSKKGKEKEQQQKKQTGEQGFVKVGFGDRELIP